MKSATLDPPTTPDISKDDEAARAARLNNARRLIRELIENDPEVAAMVAAAANGNPSDTADPEWVEFRASAPVSSETGRMAADRLREKFLQRKR